MSVSMFMFIHMFIPGKFLDRDGVNGEEKRRTRTATGTGNRDMERNMDMDMNTERRYFISDCRYWFFRFWNRLKFRYCDCSDIGTRDLKSDKIFSYIKFRFKFKSISGLGSDILSKGTPDAKLNYFFPQRKLHKIKDIII
jgi:hypothetical protein